MAGRSWDGLVDNMRICRSLTYGDSELRGQRCSQSTEAVGMSEEERRKVQSGKCNTIELVVWSGRV